MYLTGDKKAFADMFLDFLYKENRVVSKHNFEKFIKKQGMSEFYQVNKLNLFGGGIINIEFIKNDKKYEIEWKPQ